LVAKVKVECIERDSFFRFSTYVFRFRSLDAAVCDRQVTEPSTHIMCHQFFGKVAAVLPFSFRIVSVMDCYTRL